MAIDQNLRNQLFQQQQQKNLFKEVFAAAADAVEIKKDMERILTLLEEKNTRSEDLLDKIGRAIALIFNKIPKSTVLPKIFTVSGKVEVSNPIEIKNGVKITNISELETYFRQFEKRIVTFQTELSKLNKQSSLSVDNLPELAPYFQSLEARIGSLAQAISSMPQPKIEFPKIPKMEAPQIKLSLQEVVDELKNLQDNLGKSKGNNDNLLPVMRRMQQDIQNFVSRPQMTPQPVTNVTLNALQGFVKTTDNTVGTTVTRLPSYGQLFNRRALQIYNNSNNTIFIGGSDVTINNGIPVPGNSYSNIIDAGYNMIVYGIASQSGNDVRCLEVSKDQTQNIQE